MAERCELCGARWEVGASTCRDCGSRRRITVPPQESSASMSGMTIVRDALASGATPSSASSSDVAMVRVDASSAAHSVAPSSAEIPAARQAPASAPPASGLRDPFDSEPFPVVPPPSPSASLSPSRTTTIPPGAPTPLPPGFSQPLSHTAGRRALPVLAAVLVLAGAIGAGMWLTRPAAEPEAAAPTEALHVGTRSSCDELAALAGSWVFTTATTGARRKERLGMRGFYQLEITVDGCTARASLAKTGRTNRTAFDDEKVPRAEAELAQGEGAESYGWSGTFGLRNEDDQGIDTRFVFALDGERLVGSWRQLGERWTSSGLYGVLEGRRDGDPVAILPERSTQPCAVRCATPDDITLLDTPSQPAHAACMAACE